MQIIVGAAIVHRNRVLAAQRAEPPALAGGWEFPGGKVEAGESEEEALVRECHEELAVEIEVGERLGPDVALQGGAWLLRVWVARLVAGTPTPLEHSELRWLTRGELSDVAWLPADLPLIAQLRRLLPAG
ncbi:MAG: (deoxy)nucleoside triphosphate pyrophosphohydrolase [Pseudonocardiales bacterium]